MSQLGFYHWIRDGVRRAVLLGVSDAVQELGLPQEHETVHERLLAVLASPRPLDAPQPVTGKEPRKRLGRSLEQIVPQTRAT